MCPVVVSVFMLCIGITSINCADDCPANTLEVFTDNTCITMHLIPAFTNMYGSNVTYRCNSRLEQLPTANIDYCPVELCESPGDWTVGYLSCAQNECYNISSSNLYSGRRNCGLSGTECQAWNVQIPHTHGHVDADFNEGDINLVKNYCRDPLGSKGQPWCFTTDINIQWEYCEIQQCIDLPITYGGCTEPTTTESPFVCPAPPDIPNTIKVVEGTQTGDSAVYNCVPGFVYTSGEFTHTCTGGGLWEGDSPVCTEIVSGQIAEFKYKTIQQEMHDYAQIKYIQNTRSNVLCASTCSKQPLCNMYMFSRSNHVCSIYTFNMNGSNIMCTGNAVCYLRSL